MRTVKIEFPESKVTVYADLVNADKHPELAEEIWAKLEKPMRTYAHNTLSTGDFMLTKPLPPYEVPPIGNQTEPLGGVENVPFLDDMVNGEILWGGWYFAPCYGISTEPMVGMGPIMLKVQEKYLNDFQYAGHECWNGVYLYHKPYTVVYSRGEE